MIQIVNRHTGEVFETRGGKSSFESICNAKRAFSMSVDEVNAESIGLSLVPKLEFGVWNYYAPKFEEQNVYVTKER